MSDLSLAEVHAEVVRLAALAASGDYDPETTHGDTDDLYVTVLGAVAAGHPDATAMAVEALKIGTFGLTRWYA